nr:MAG TPA: hypothetical protein [Bacteriophage sp.]
MASRNHKSDFLFLLDEKMTKKPKSNLFSHSESERN